MTEKTHTVTHSGLGGITFHPERDIAVMWTDKGAERRDTKNTFKGEVNWYGDTISEKYTVQE